MTALTRLVPAVAGIALFLSGASLISCALKGTDGDTGPAGVTVNDNPTYGDPTQPFDITKINHVIVIYQENWSFDGLYSQFPGLSAASRQTFSTTAVANPAIAQKSATNGALPFNPWPINSAGSAIDTTSFNGWTIGATPQFWNLANPPAALGIGKLAPDAITGDIRHQFYTNKAQMYGISGTYTAGSAAGAFGATASNQYYMAFSDNNPGLVMSGFDASYMPEGKLAQQYTMCDMTFQAAFGGSFLNHQYLIAAAAPKYGPTNTAWTTMTPAAMAAAMKSSTSDYRDSSYIPYTPKETEFGAAGGAAGTIFGATAAISLDPNQYLSDATTQIGKYGVNWPTTTGLGWTAPDPVTKKTWDTALTMYKEADGNYYGVNTMSPPFWPTYAGSAAVPAYLPPQTNKHIGDLLSGAGKSWKWYSEGWKLAVNNGPANISSSLFQAHHQPFNYFANCAPGQPFRKNLQDLTDLYKDLDAGTLPNVSFVKFQGANNEHPGYANLSQGQQAVADLVAKIQASGAWKDTAIFITYDEYGGRFDHVAPPAARDAWGAGTRIPMIVISPFAKRGYIDSTPYDTISILRFIEKRWNLGNLSASDASTVFGNLLNAFSNNPVSNG